ncbi:MAG: 30S ribosomal protein S2 [Candidatus Paceibacterota bacterium]|jgi:small subunit ribosomal protein S2
MKNDLKEGSANEVDAGSVDIKSGPMGTLFSVGAHLGYSKSKRHPSAKNYVFGSKNRVDIIDLEKTLVLLNKALDFVYSLAKDGKQILFVGNKYESRKVMAAAAERIAMPYFAERWIGGALTNFSEIKKRIAKFEDLLMKKEKGGLDVYTKKERGRIDKEIADLNRRFGGIVCMRKLPGALFVIDSKDEQIAIDEAKVVGIPVIAICSTDCNIKHVDYPIVANDSSIESIRFFVDKIVSAYQDALRGKVGRI